MNDFFEGPDYSKEDTNKFKDLYLVRYYPNPARPTIEVLSLGDLGRVPENSVWGNIRELRDAFEEYRCITTSKPNRVEWTHAGSLLHYNNCDIFMTKALNIRDALDKFWAARGYC